MLVLQPALRAPAVYGSSVGELLAWAMLFLTLLALVSVPKSLKRRRRAKVRDREQSL